MPSFFKCSLPIYSFLIFAFLLLGCSSGLKPSTSSEAQREQFSAQGLLGAVAAEGAPIAQTALDILKRGGNAYDAAVAASFMAGVYRPQATGIGGGGFLLGYLSEKRDFVFVDMREQAPQEATVDYFQALYAANPDLPPIGANFVAVPGLLSGLWEIYQMFGSGKLEWKELLAPSIELASSGFVVYPHLAEAISFVAERGYLDSYPEAKRLLSNSDSSLFEVGNIMRQPELAATLEIIANNGPLPFYRGTIARQITQTIQSNQGIIRRTDLADYRIQHREPIEGVYRDFRIVSAPLPSAGGTSVIQMFQTLEALETLRPGQLSAFLPQAKVEVLAKAFSDRERYAGDPGFLPELNSQLASKGYAEQLAKEIVLGASVNPDSLDEKNEPLSTSTTHFSIVDAQGNVVSSTQSINHYFGSMLVAGNTGIFLNNHMDDFVLVPKRANTFGLKGDSPNYVEGGKRPVSSMSPTIIMHNNQFFLALGSPGGPRIISSVFQVGHNVLAGNQAMFDAVAAHRLHYQNIPDTVFVEDVTSEDAKLLQSLGYQIEESIYGIGNVSAVHFDELTKTYTAVADPRRLGEALAY